MSVSHCMGQALAIAKQPLDDWAAAIEVVPAECKHPDCGEPRNCRKRIAEYLRVQYRMRKRRDEAAGSRAR